MLAPRLAPLMTLLLLPACQSATTLADTEAATELASKTQR